MTTYYPSQGSHYAQPAMVYAPSNQGYYADGYYPGNGGVAYVPTHSSRRSRRHHHHHHHHHHDEVVAPVVASSAPVVVASTSHGDGYYHDGHHHHHLSIGERIRRFFGLAPRGYYKYKSNKGFWGFLGHSRRQRYMDARTGAEVDRKGRPIYRV